MLPGVQRPTHAPVRTDPSVLDTPETNTHLHDEAAPPLLLRDPTYSDNRSPRSDLPTVTFRHSGWAQVRTRVWRALQDIHASPSRLDAFEECGNDAWVLESATNPGEYRIASNKCHDRFCGPCGGERSRVIAQNVVRRLGRDPARFLTLTLRARSEPLSDTITRLYKSFSRLRTLKLWRKSVTGGVAFLEVKRSRSGPWWHVHLHAIIQGRFINKTKLSRAWERVTQDSFMVDIRLIRNNADATHYVAKYASKPLDPTTTREHNALVEAIEALRGRRLCTTFGTWRDFVLTETPDADEWIAVAPLKEILQDASNGDGTAQAILDALERPSLCRIPRPPPKNCTPDAAPGQPQLPWTEHRSVQDVPPF